MDADSENKDDKKEILRNAYLSAQENLISALMMLPERIIDVMSILTDDDFEDAPCRYIYHAMTTMVADGGVEALDVGTLQTELEKEGHLTAVGGQRKIITLYEAGLVAAAKSTVDTYARTVKDIAAKHRTRDALKELSKYLSPDSGRSARDVLENAQHEFTDIMGTLENVNTAANISDYYSTFVEDLKKRRETYQTSGGDELQSSGGIPTGFDSLNRMLGGWQRGNMITVGAKTGVGKSISAVDFAMAAAESGVSVLFFSMEMTLPEIMTRFVACATGLPIGKIKSGNLDDSGMKRVEEATNLVKMKIRIDTSQNATIDYIRSSAQKMAQSDIGLDLVIIDYLGLIKYSGNYRSDRQNQVSEISRSIKEMAMTLEIPVIVLVQLTNRDRGEDAEKEPTLAMIRESGAIANDSNAIILLHRRPQSSEERHKEEEPTKFIVAKNRNGGTGSFLCNSWLWKSKFDEIPENGNGTFGSGDEDASTDVSSVSTPPTASQPPYSGQGVDAEPPQSDSWAGVPSDSSDASAPVSAPSSTPVPPTSVQNGIGFDDEDSEEDIEKLFGGIE